MNAHNFASKKCAQVAFVVAGMRAGRGDANFDWRCCVNVRAHTPHIRARYFF